MAIALYADSPQSVAVSDAQYVRRVFKTHRSGSWVYQEPIANILSELMEIQNDCRMPGWNGYDASPISNDTIIMAREVGLLVPSWMPTPDITPEADGEISFSWYKGPVHQFSFSIGPRGILSYAGILGSEKIYGTTYLTQLADGLPHAIRESLNRLHGFSLPYLR